MQLMYLTACMQRRYEHVNLWKASFGHWLTDRMASVDCFWSTCRLALLSDRLPVCSSLQRKLESAAVCGEQLLYICLW